MTIDAAYTRWAETYDADPNASELHPKRQYLGSQARFLDLLIFTESLVWHDSLYAQKGRYSANFLDLFSGSEGLTSFASTASWISTDTIERCFSGILSLSRRLLFVRLPPERCFNTACW